MKHTRRIANTLIFLPETIIVNCLWEGNWILGKDNTMYENVEKLNYLASSLVQGKETAVMELMKQGAEFYIKSKWDSGVLEDEFWGFDGEKFILASEEPHTLDELVARADSKKNCYEVGIRFGGEDFVGGLNANTYYASDEEFCVLN